MASRALSSALVALSVAAAPRAQSYDDLTMVRGRPQAFSSLLQVRAGVLVGFPDQSDAAVGLEREVGWDGHAYFHGEGLGGRRANLDVYAGRDGLYLGAQEGELLGGGTQSRLELTGRLWPFYREGYYRGDDFVPTGRYEGRDFGAALSIAKEVAEQLRFEVGLAYKRMLFDANGDTASNYTIPDDFNAYGPRLALEHNTLQLDRVTGRPREGFILTLVGEREQNDSDRQFGVQGIFESTLPSGLWRGRGHLEWFFPQSDGATWGVVVDASLTDEEDRVYNYDAQKPQGNLWVDGQLRFRLDLGQALWLTPFARGQYVRILEDNGVGSDSKVFLGGGLDAGLDLGDALGLLGSYSYLSNESREPVSVSEDTFGEHRAFLGVQVRFGATRR